MRLLMHVVALSLMALPAVADPDVEHGEKDFNKCKACHLIANGDEMIQKGGKVGPNLFGVIGRTAGTLEGYKYSPDMVAAGEAGLVWDTENLPTYLVDPKTFLRDFLGKDNAQTKMTYKLKDGEDVAAYLASLNG